MSSVEQGVCPRDCLFYCVLTLRSYNCEWKMEKCKCCYLEQKQRYNKFDAIKEEVAITPAHRSGMCAGSERVLL